MSNLIMPSPKVRITLDLTPEASTALNDLIDLTGQDMDVIFRKALALYKLAKEASRDGKSVGVATTPEALETKFEGL